MITTTTPYDDIKDGADVPLSIEEFATIIQETISQPPWRMSADKEADYADGNQLDSELLRKQQELGIPPAKENIIGPAIAAVCGYEAKIRKDWRVTPDGDLGGQDVADVINFRLNQAEKRSGADRSMSRAFRPQVAVGLGWVEVTRAPNSLMFPIRCQYVHRNEIWWDMKSTDGCSPSLPTARWLVRRRWVERQRAAQMFPKHKEIISTSSADWLGTAAGEIMEGGQSTGLQSALDAERAWTKVEDAWYNAEARTVCITEVWYRRWVPTLILKMKDGRAVEYDDQNQVHQAAVMAGRGKLVEELIPRMRQAYWMGPHMLHDGKTPHPHDKFPYVPFFGYTEDMTGIPFGLVRDMLFPQDNLNSSIAKLRWGMSSVRTERTKGAVQMSDNDFRRTVARSNADIILDPAHMAQPGARFDVKRDFQLNDQQFNLMNDSRAAIQRVSGITSAFQGQQGTATSGVQEQTQVEQSQVSIADLMDNFEESRACVGELMMSMLIADMGEEEQQIVIEGDVLNPPRTVVINKPEVDPLTNIRYLSNDIQRTRLKVSLDDVPSSSSFRAQQLAALSEAVKSMTPEMQQVTMPFMLDLMDLPRKKEVVEAIRGATGQQSPEQMREQIKQELMHELKLRELDIKERIGDAQIKQLMAQAVQTGVQAAFSAMQGGAQIAMNPLIAPIADEIMKGAGYQAPNPGGVDPNFPVPAMPAPVQDAAAQTLPGAQANTSPAFPPVPQGAEQGMQGIETPTTADNLGAPA